MSSQGGVNLRVGFRVGRLGVSTGGNYQFQQRKGTAYTLGVERSSWQVLAATYIPIHRARPGASSRRSIQCPVWGPKKQRRQRGSQDNCLSGSLLVETGYKAEDFQYSLQSNAVENGPTGVTYGYHVTNNGSLTNLSYLLQWWRFNLGFGYSAFLSFPKGSGQVNIPGDLNTGSQPIPHRLAHGPIAQLGFTIQL